MTKAGVMPCLLVLGVLAAAPPATATGSTTTTPSVPSAAVAVEPFPAHPTAADLGRLQTALTDASQKSAAAATAAERASAQQAAIRVAEGDAEAALTTARAAMSTDVRRLYIAGQADAGLGEALGISPNLGTFGRVRSARLTLDNSALRTAHKADSHLAALADQAQRNRIALIAQATVAEEAQSRARALLDAAKTAWAHDQTVLAQLRAYQAALDAEAARVAAAASTAYGTTGTAGIGSNNVNADEGPIVQLLEDTPAGQLPAGYHPTGQVITGVASWYGPGFAGHPTSTGAIYDPERLTAAMLAVPLGTVVRVTNQSGVSVNVLVNDHGPYVGGRVIDLSHRAAQILGIGLSPVTVQVLAKS
jgi:hypothetical protein